jgi:putative IMPACT (imprinted ancient) family translation regulator
MMTIFIFYDDGEPSGTQANHYTSIDHSNKKNVLVIVIVFWRNKLGVGPLFSCYYVPQMHAFKALPIKNYINFL